MFHFSIDREHLLCALFFLILLCNICLNLFEQTPIIKEQANNYNQQCEDTRTAKGHSDDAAQIIRIELIYQANSHQYADSRQTNQTKYKHGIKIETVRRIHSGMAIFNRKVLF